jgi:microcystin-dependent protein
MAIEVVINTTTFTVTLGLANPVTVQIPQTSISITLGVGPPGPPGRDGRPGTDGADGVGVPVGGSTGQVLTKHSNTDFDTDWENAAAGELTGVVKMYAGSSAPAGYLLCDGSSYSTSTYAALFSVIGYTFGGSGNNFNVPDMRGRVPIGVGTGAATDTIVPVSAANSITWTVPSNSDKWTNGKAITYNTTGASPGSLPNGSTRYVVRLSSTSIALCSTYQDALFAADYVALNGPSNLYTTGLAIIFGTFAFTGTQSMTATFTARSLGQGGGEESHTQIVAEASMHVHNYFQGQNAGNTYAFGSDSNRVWEEPDGGDSTSGPQVFGNTFPTPNGMNIVQPYRGLNFIIKT